MYEWLPLCVLGKFCKGPHHYECYLLVLFLFLFLLLMRNGGGDGNGNGDGGGGCIYFKYLGWVRVASAHAAGTIYLSR